MATFRLFCGRRCITLRNTHAHAKCLHAQAFRYATATNHCPLRLKPSVVANSKFKTECGQISQTDTNISIFLSKGEQLHSWTKAHEHRKAREKNHTDLDKRQAHTHKHTHGRETAQRSGGDIRRPYKRRSKRRSTDPSDRRKTLTRCDGCAYP